MTTDRLYGLPGAEDMLDCMEDVAQRAWDDGMESPIKIEEYTTKQIRSFVKAEHLLDHIVEYQLEEALDEYGKVADKLEARSKEPHILALFDTALDRFLEDIGWCWADRLVATWVCEWTGEFENPTFTKEEK